MRRSLWCVLGASALLGCVPADEAVGLGSVQFTWTVSARTRDGLEETEVYDGWALRFDRIVLGFKTMTIGQIGVADVCSYRGRGEAADVVFDPRAGLAQTFNGIQPVTCPDVGVIFGAPSDTTTLGQGVTSRDLVELASGAPAHAIVEATATRERDYLSRELRIVLRFDSLRTSTRFGGCRAAARGVRILEGQRDEVTVRFAAENVFRDAISTSARLRVNPFADADRAGDGDGVVTMAELDGMSLSDVAARYNNFYQLPDGTQNGTFGDFVRALYRFTVMFRTEDGICVGNEPGSEEGGQPEP